MPYVLEAGGLRLPLEQTSSGPLIAASAEPDAEALAWVVNAAVTGMLPGLRDKVAGGEDVIVQGLSAARPDPRDDYQAAAAAWRRLTGRDAGDDAYVVGTTFSDSALLLPRQALLEILDGLQRLREPRDEQWSRGPTAGDLDELERRAADVDLREATPPQSGEEAGTLSAKRRFLLLALDQAGVLGADPPPELEGHPILASYREAASELRRYLSSPQRQELVAGASDSSVAGAPVSLDWFRRPSRRPNPLEHPFHWLAAGEATLRAASLDEQSGEGVVLIKRGGDWWGFRWRRDDGVTPVLVSAAPMR